MADDITVANDDLTNYVVETTDNGGVHTQHVLALTALIDKDHDFIDCGYDGSENLTSIVAKVGGSGGTTVATITITYTGSNGDLIDTITKS